MFNSMIRTLGPLLALFFLALQSCDPIVTQFEDIEDGEMYTAKHLQPPPSSVETICVMTWNIRFGAGREKWFGDSNGTQVCIEEDHVYYYLGGIAAMLEEIEPDVLLLQEVDIQSKRSAYIDQMQWLLDHTHFNYGAYASVWRVQTIPSDGLGRMDEGNAVLSRWPITKAVRIQLPLRGDQDALTRHFYVRDNILIIKIALPGLDNFYAVNVHTTAFAMDDTKKQQLDIFKNELDKLAAQGFLFIAGGDLNSLPVNATKTDYCLEDKKDDESFHGPNDDPKHKEGSYYTPQIAWLQALYDAYSPAVSLENYGANESQYFTHTPQWDNPYDRKLDYLFTNTKWTIGSDSTYQIAAPWSDHAPVSAQWEMPK
jgi:endonuclease/exonuclease/phosphatase family metal-dependent hydrolase